MVCSVCFDLQLPDHPDAIPRHTVRRYQESGHAGCLACQTVLDAVDTFAPGAVNRLCSNGSIVMSIDEDGYACITLYREETALSPMIKLFRSQDDPPEPVGRARIPASLDIVTDTLSDEAFSRVNLWLADCVDHHDECKIPDPTFKPSRLVKIGSLDANPQLSLVIPTRPSPYVALSYCWGPDTKDVCMSTPGNLESYFNSIPFSKVPQTIRDAVKVCQQINVLYLWVDSLCIVKDAVYKDDWLRESGKMAGIYSNSHLTIAAQGPLSCKTGFLGKQQFGDEKWQRSFHSNWPGSGPLGRMFVRERVRDIFVREHYSLETRGWTVQEGILPNRILHFTGKEMAWECNRRTFCECGHMVTEISGPFLKTLFRKGDNKSSAKDTLKDGWIRIIADYVKRQLTEETDKLVAISGLAKSISESAAELLQSEKSPRPEPLYLAGIWREGLPDQLLWNTFDDLDDFRHTRPSEYRAPTWSWASINGRVRFLYYHRLEKSYITVSECQCEPASLLNPMGDVKSGYLVVTGLLAPVQLVTIQSELNINSPGEAISRWRHAFYAGMSSVRGEDFVSYEIATDVLRSVDLNKGDPGYECWINGRCMGTSCGGCRFEKTETPFFCLKAALCKSNRGVDELCSLVLQKSSTVEGAYERIGIGLWHGWPAFNTPWVDKAETSLFGKAEMATIKIV